MKITPILTNGLVTQFTSGVTNYTLKSPMTIENFASSVINIKGVEITDGFFVFKGAADGVSPIDTSIYVIQPPIKGVNNTPFELLLTPNTPNIYVTNDTYDSDKVLGIICSFWHESQRADQQPIPVINESVYTTKYVKGFGIKQLNGYVTWGANVNQFMYDNPNGTNSPSGNYGIEINLNVNAVYFVRFRTRWTPTRGNPYPQAIGGDITGRTYDEIMQEILADFINDTNNCTLTRAGQPPERFFSSNSLTRSITFSFEVKNGVIINDPIFDWTYHRGGSTTFPNNAAVHELVNSFVRPRIFSNVNGKNILVIDYGHIDKGGEDGQFTMAEVAMSELK